MPEYSMLRHIFGVGPPVLSGAKAPSGRNRRRFLREMARSGSSGAPSLFPGEVLAAGYLGDAFHAPRRLHDLLQVRQVLDFDEHRAGRPAVDRPELHAP